MIFHRTMAGFLVELEDLAILAYLKLLVDQEESPYFIEKRKHSSILHVKVKKYCQLGIITPINSYKYNTTSNI